VTGVEAEDEEDANWTSRVVESLLLEYLQSGIPAPVVPEDWLWAITFSNTDRNLQLVI
jgi:hypothetical protein